MHKISFRISAAAVVLALVASFTVAQVPDPSKSEPEQDPSIVRTSYGEFNIRFSLRMPPLDSPDFNFEEAWRFHRDCSHIKIIGDRAYLAGETEIVILDKVDSPSPVELSFLDASSLEINSMAVSGDNLYFSNETNSLQIVNISNPKNPILEPSFVTKAKEVKLVGIEGQRVYLELLPYPNRDNSLNWGSSEIVAYSPLQISTRQPSPTIFSLPLEWNYTCMVEGSTFFTGSEYAGFQAYDVSTAMPNRISSNRLVGRNIKQIWRLDSLIFVDTDPLFEEGVCMHGEGPDLLVYDGSGFALSRRLGSISKDAGGFGGYMNFGDVTENGSIVFMTIDNELFAFDFNDKDRPVLMGRYDTKSFASDIEFANGMIYLACREKGVIALKFNDSRPVAATPASAP